MKSIFMKSIFMKSIKYIVILSYKMYKHANNKVSKELVKATNNIVNMCNIKSDNSHLSNKTLDIIYRLYEELKTYQNEINTDLIRQIEREVDNSATISGDIKQGLMSKYVSKQIREFIFNKSRVQVHYKLIGRIEWVIIFTLYGDVDTHYLEYLDMCACNIFCLLKFLDKYRSDDCKIERLELYIFLTEFRKMLPSSKNITIGPVNVNSGSTRPCQATTKITIFRQEEFMKLVIHETVHALGIDIPYRYNGYYTEKLDQIFGIESTYNLNETYTEMSALIVNSLMVVLQSDKVNSDRRTIQKLIANCLHIETIYSRIQVIKILDFLSLSLKDLAGKSKITNFREDTHVFAYYILKYLLLENIDDFIEVCNTFNTIGKNDEGLILKFSHGLSDSEQRGKIDVLIKLIQSLINNKDFLEKFDRDEKNLLSTGCPYFRGLITKTLRMTALELA